MDKGKKTNWVLVTCSIICAGIQYSIYNKVNDWMDIAKWLLIALVGAIVALLSMTVLLNLRTAKNKSVAGGILSGVIASGITYAVWGKDLLDAVEEATGTILNISLAVLMIVVLTLAARAKAQD